MTNSKNTKRALLMSVLSMMLCMAMLIGSTFAWFTDSVTSGKNKIVAGNLDVALYNVKDGKETPVTADTNLFLEDALWEPGHVEVVNLKVANVGTLALTYKFGINVASEQRSVNVDGDIFRLSDYIKFALIDGNQNFGTGDEGRAAAITAAEANAVALSALAVDENGVLYPDGKGDSERYVTLVVYMPTTVGNEANYRAGEKIPTIELGINLLATQTPYENDSFGNNYDDPAKEVMITGTNKWFDADSYNDTKEYSISKASDLLALQNAVAAGYDFSGKSISLTGDVDLSAYENWAPIGSEDKPFAGIFDGANNTISGLKITEDAAGLAGLFGKVKEATIQNLTVVGNITLSSAYGPNELKDNALCLGGICAKGESVTVSNCTNNVEIDASTVTVNGDDAYVMAYTGGIVGVVVTKGTFSDCHNTVKLGAFTDEAIGESYVCGITSVAYLQTVTIDEKCSNSGELVGMGTNDAVLRG